MIGRRAFLGIGTLAAIAAAGAAAAGFKTDDDTTIGSSAHGTATVERTTLTDSKTFVGTLEYGDPVPFTGRLAGTITGLPSTGTVLRSGDAVYRVDDRPVVLMRGVLPAYRDLAVGLRGRDVRQLKENLRAFGFGGSTADDRYTAATARAIRHWQRRAGLEPTGTVEFGRVVFRPGPLRVGTVTARVGDTAGGPLFVATATDRLVRMSIESADRRLAPKGARATVQLPGDRTTGGKVRELIESADQPPKLTAIVRLDDQRAVAGLDGAVEVELVADERRDVLAVPVVALLAVDGRRYAVEVVDRGATRRVPVELGLFADRRVEIRGDGIAAGTTVSVPLR